MAASPDMLENDRLAFSFRAAEAEGESVSDDSRLGALANCSVSSPVKAWFPSLPSIEMILCARSLMYPLLGPRFCGILLNSHALCARLQLVHATSPGSKNASHLTFFRRHSSQARETFDRFLGGMPSSYCIPANGICRCGGSCICGCCAGSERGPGCCA